MPPQTGSSRAVALCSVSAGALCVLSVAAGGEAQGILDGIAIEIFVAETPAGFRLVVLLVIVGEDAGESAGAMAASAAGWKAVFRFNAWAGRWVVDDGLQHGRHGTRRNVALALDDLRAIGGEDDGRRPAVILIAIGDVGPRILVDFDQDVALVEQADDDRIAVSDVVHDVAPVAPDGFKIEQDEFVLCAGLRESSVRPGLPVEGGLWLRLG